MKIDIQEISSVDREITITATEQDLAVSIDKALRKLRSTLNMPGFRPGQVPINIVKKRFGKDVEFEEARKFVLDIYENDIVPDHKPVGETQFFDMKWENGQLEARLRIGVAPQFDLADITKISVDKLIHDVTDAEVEDELQRMLKKEATWSEVDGPVTADHRVTVDATLLNDKGEAVEGSTEEGQVVDLSLDSNKQIREALLGKKSGYEAEVSLGEAGNTDRYRIALSKIEAFEAKEPDAEFFQKLSNGSASTIDEFRTQLKSEIQKYYDQQSDEMFNNDMREMIIAAHTFDIPTVVIDMVTNAFYEDYAKRMDGKIPADFDMEQYRETVRPSAISEARWSFISEALVNKYPDLELSAEDVDAYLANEAARYNIPVEYIKQYYASNTQMLNDLRLSIRGQKLFAKLTEEVNINGLDKDSFAARQRERHEAQHKHNH